MPSPQKSGAIETDIEDSSDDEPTSSSGSDSMGDVGGKKTKKTRKRKSNSGSDSEEEDDDEWVGQPLSEVGTGCILLRFQLTGGDCFWAG
jgi:hypothetical protein